MLFQNAVFQRDGQDGFAEVFRKPPVSTQQILHPEKYFAGVKPTEPALPDRMLRGYKGLVGGTMGELEHGILLEQYVGKERPAELAPHWKGSHVRAAGEQEGGAGGAAVRGGVGQRGRGAAILHGVPRDPREEMEVADGRVGGAGRADGRRETTDASSCGAKARSSPAWKASTLRYTDAR